MKTWTEIPKINLYSDGGAEPNPGKGGYGIILSWNGEQKEFYGGFKMTTNNRMELMGVIKGLELLKTKSEVMVYTDSKYVIDGIEKGWAKKWKLNNWYRNKQEKAINIDLWDKLLELIEQHNVKFNWVKGHNGHIENERCDFLASKAINLDNLAEDSGFNSQNNNTTSPKREASNFTNSKQKIQKAGDLCRKCNTPVVLKTPENRKIKEHQTYYFEYCLYCPVCKTVYMVEEAKRSIDSRPLLFD